MGSGLFCIRGDPLYFLGETLKHLVAVIFFLVTITAGAQTKRETHMLNPLPWNGDWLQERHDIMVHGEFFLDYPGPLPKILAAMGLDHEHPAIDHELQVLVDRESPYWFGTCNGWAGAAIQFPEPDDLVVNGVKIFSGEARALLARIWKDSVEVTQGRYDSQGMTPDSFNELLDLFIARNTPIIFDVTLGLESWNYPVAGFDRTETQDGDWTNVTVTVFYTNTVYLNFLLRQPPGTVEFLEKTYTFRYQGVTYEWTGDSLSDRPQRAWYPTLPYLPSTWFSRGNRFLSMKTFEDLVTLSTDAEAQRDRYEPNDAPENAHAVEANLVLASAMPGDNDYFSYQKLSGEPFQLDLNVYDGPNVDVVLYDASGNELERRSGICETSISLDEAYEGELMVRVEAQGDLQTSYYHLQMDEDRGHYRTHAEDFFNGAELRVVNVSEEASVLGSAELITLAPGGAALIDQVEADALYRNQKMSLWSVTRHSDEDVDKRYYKGHRLDMPYVVPHLTCRNGWQTILRLGAAGDDEVRLTVYDAAGNELQVIALPAQNEIDLGPLLSPVCLSTGAWFKLETSAENKLTGKVSYVHNGIGYRSDLDLASHPRNGELVLPNLPTADKGWVGLSIVNSSGVDNPVLWRLYNRSGQELEAGRLDLEPGQRWLGLPRSLIQTEIAEGYSLYFFSQFDVETLALRHDVEHGMDYAHRLFSSTIDHVFDSYITVPADGSGTHAYAFHNTSKLSTWVLLRGINSQGETVTEYRVGRRAMEPYSTAILTYEELMADAEIDPVDHDIAYFLPAPATADRGL